MFRFRVKHKPNYPKWQSRDYRNTGAQTHNSVEASLDDETDYAAEHDQLTKHSLRPLRVKIAQKRRVYCLILWRTGCRIHIYIYFINTHTHQYTYRKYSTTHVPHSNGDRRHISWYATPLFTYFAMTFNKSPTHESLLSSVPQLLVPGLILNNVTRCYSHCGS